MRTTITLATCVLLCHLVVPGHGDEFILYNTLINTTGYNTLVRPLLDHTQPVVVSLGMELFTIVDLDEINEIITLFCQFRATWTDEHLQWNPSDQAGIESIVMPPTKVWLPDIGIENSADTFYHETFTKDFKVRVFYDGTIVWSFGGLVGLRCDLDMTYFPFDLQTCRVQIQNWAYNGDEVLLRNSSDVIGHSSYSSNGVWDLDSTASLYEDFYLNSSGLEPIPQVDFVMYLSRKSYFYVINLIVPSVMIIFVALGVFWLPAESGEKVSLAVTVMLAFSVFQIVLAGSMPVSSDYSPVLGELVIGIMTLSTLSVLIAILVIYLHDRPVTQRVPKTVRLIFLKGLARLLCMRKEVPDVTPFAIHPDKESIKHAEKLAGAGKISGQNGNNETEMYSSQEIQILSKNLSYISQRLRNLDDDEAMKEEWKALARVIDRLFFWISVIYIILLLAVFLSRKDPTY